MKYNENEAHEIVNMVCETNEDVRNTLYEIHEPMIKFLVKKYSGVAKALGVELTDLYQEALVGFTDAINSFNPEKEASLKTFITLCIERRIQKILNQVKRRKERSDHDTLSLDYEYVDIGLPLIEVIGDERLDPLIKFSEEEQIEFFHKKMQEVLSKNEYIVYEEMKKGLSYLEIAKKLDKNPKQIDNTIQRIKNKIKIVMGGYE